MVEKFKVSEIIMKDFPVLKEEDSVSSSLSKFSEWRRDIPVLKGKSYSAMLSPVSLLVPRLEPSKSKVKSLMSYYPVLSAGISLFDCARLMVESYASALPVIQEKSSSLEGVVVIEDVLKEFLKRTGLDKEPAEKVCKEIAVFDREMLAGEAARVMSDEKRDYIILFWNKRHHVIHICDFIPKFIKPRQRIEENDIVQESVKDSEWKARDFISYELPMFPTETTVSRLMEEMTRMNRDVVGIMDGREFMGVVSKKSLLRIALGHFSQEVSVSIKFSGDYYSLPTIERESLRDIASNFADKFAEFHEGGIVKITIKKPESKKRFELKFMARSPRETFFVEEEGHRLTDLMQQGVRRLERQVFEEKRRTNDMQKSGRQ